MKYVLKACQIAETIFSWLFIVGIWMFFLFGGEISIKINGLQPTIEAFKSLF